MSQVASPAETEIVRRLLATACSTPTATPAETDAVGYDWHSPHRLTPAQQRRVAALAESLAAAAAGTLGELLHEEMSLRADRPVEVYAEALVREAGEAGCFCLAGQGKDGQPVAAITVPAPKGIAWVARLLGGAGGQESDRELSALETTILTDALGKVLAAVSGALSSAGGGGFSPDGELCRGELPLDAAGGDSFCRIMLRQGGAEGDDGVALIVLTDALAAAGAPAAQAAATVPGQARRQLTEHLSRTQVVVDGRLRTTAAMRDVLALEPGDVLLTSRREDQPVDVLVGGRRIAAGLPVCCDGRYALQVVPDGEQTT